eukprot:scaffold85250_cov68-Cyclotella_meneghiniana.AAC.1
MVQNITGSGIRQAKLQFCNSKSYNERDRERIEKLFEKLFFCHDTKTEISQEYKKYYPRDIEFANVGGLHLISIPFMKWAINLHKEIASGYNQSNLVQDKRMYIATNMKRIKQKADLFSQFEQAASSCGVVLDKDILNDIYLRIVLFSFRAYSGELNNRIFNKAKTS